MSNDPEHAALVALIGRVEEVGVRPGTDLADAVANAKAALAGAAPVAGDAQPSYAQEQPEPRWAYIEGYAAGAAHFGGPATETPAVLRAPIEYEMWRKERQPAPVREPVTLDVTREWCMAAAQSEADAGDPDCTTGQPDWKARYEQEYDIVSRCWTALGVSEYDGGLPIWERIAALRRVSSSPSPAQAGTETSCCRCAGVDKAIESCVCRCHAAIATTGEPERRVVDPVPGTTGYAVQRIKWPAPPADADQPLAEQER